MRGATSDSQPTVAYAIAIQDIRPSKPRWRCGSHAGYAVGPMFEARQATAAILLVEDDPKILRAQAQGLRRAEYEVREAASSKAAMDALPDLAAGRIEGIVTDILLGEETCIPLVQAAMALSRPPWVIAVTGLASRADVIKLFRLGVADILEKPVYSSDLLKVIAATQDEAKSLALDVAKLVGRRPMPDVLYDAELTMTVEALVKTGGNITKAAEILGISRQQLQHLIRARRCSGKALDEEWARLLSGRAGERQAPSSATRETVPS